MSDKMVDELIDIIRNWIDESPEHLMWLCQRNITEWHREGYFAGQYLTQRELEQLVRQEQGGTC